MTPTSTTPTAGHSALYSGWVRHRRFAPVAHAFEMPVFMVYLDLYELESGSILPDTILFSHERSAPARFAREDYFGPAALPLSIAVRDRVEAVTGRRPDGPIRLLTNLRYLGYCFNPVSFYYGFDGCSPRLSFILAEITNTPWNQRHAYLLDCGRPPGQCDEPLDGATAVDRFIFPKAFHVSPFMPMEIEYDWSFTPPSERLSVHMNLKAETPPADGCVCPEERAGASKPAFRSKAFDATLNLTRSPLTPATLLKALIRFPLLTARVMARIHWEALCLWYKGVPISTHPERRGLVHPVRDLAPIKPVLAQAGPRNTAHSD